MVLLVGTFDGLFALNEDGTGPERQLDATIHRLHAVEDGCIAATETGLYRTTDGRTWDHVAEFPGAVVATAVSPDSDRWYVGTDHAAVHLSTDDGASSTPSSRSPTASAGATVRPVTTRASGRWRSIRTHPSGSPSVSSPAAST
ncbi:hypothetical protein [Haloarchaeobius sp. FL176]|uniref:WD40/YVTN/BNR-like repeat-containing protein n=1 Tax=Haloarchaeobius sp. FL176 TaxID=2967129 RepID=UPI002148A6F9|nr:hypothetical protein [Haloarchaeobius sp. FL176]